MHDPVLQESQKKFWLFKHNFRALDLTWSDYVIVNKSTWVWELHNCQLTLVTNLIKLSWKSQKRQYFCTCMALFTCFYFLLWMKSTKCRNIADCNIFALLWITALSWSNIFASTLRMLPFFVFQEENLCHDKKSPKYLSQDVYKVVKSTQSVKWYWDRAHCQRQSAIFLRKANYDWIGCAIYLHSNNKFALSQVNKVRIQYFCF